MTTTLALIRPSFGPGSTAAKPVPRAPLSPSILAAQRRACSLDGEGLHALVGPPHHDNAQTGTPLCTSSEEVCVGPQAWCATWVHQRRRPHIGMQTAHYWDSSACQTGPTNC